jgi:CheY-like chemotaxis protein
MTVLIVDDDDDMRDMEELCVSVDGFDTATASDGVRALEWLRAAHEPSLVLLDLRMPRMNGFELLSVMKRDPALAAVPVVIVTGDAAAGTSAMAVGAAAFLVKPLEADEITAAVRRFALKHEHA